MEQFKNAMEIFKLLDKSNFRKCNEKTFMLTRLIINIPGIIIKSGILGISLTLQPSSLIKGRCKPHNFSHNPKKRTEVTTCLGFS